MKRTVRISALLVAVLMLLSLCGCGSSNHSSQSYTAAREDGAYAADYDFEGYAAAEMAADEAYGFAPVPRAMSRPRIRKRSSMPPTSRSRRRPLMRRWQA